MTTACEYCDKAAAYSVPRDLCEEHWFKTFWLADYTPEELKKIVQDSDNAAEVQAAKELLDIEKGSA